MDFEPIFDGSCASCKKEVQCYLHGKMWKCEECFFRAKKTDFIA